MWAPTNIYTKLKKKDPIIRRNQYIQKHNVGFLIYFSQKVIDQKLSKEYRETKDILV